VQQLSSAAAEIMASVQQINRGSQQQAAATHQTSAALNQIEGIARAALAKASEAGNRLTGMKAATEASRDAVENLISRVNAAVADSQHSVTTIQRLDDTGRRIAKIVDGISLTTIQTSMLAVSGAVEAARADDAGRGFAVVSNDIRTLARDAGANIERAKDTVRAVLDQIGALRREIEQIITASYNEVQNNKEIIVSMRGLDADIAALAGANTSILEGADEILAAATETATAARQIAAAAEEASTASRQAATAAMEQAKGAEDLAAAIEEIASLADELKRQNG
jgi:methyl-accepting chemotaxis protein